MSGTVILRFEHLTKRFPGVLAVSDASLDIKAGEIHSIVGGNGAGKSTLMKMLSGVYPADSYEGSISLLGENCAFQTILDAQNKGIFMVPQDINMANDMSVAENLFMGKQPTRHGMVDVYTMFKQTSEILKEFNLDVSPTTKVREIGIAQKQLIVIARAISNNVKVLLLDEPTSTLSDKECIILFEKVRELRERGIACVFISHRLEEVKAISDVITVMRDGQIVGTDSNKDMTEKRIVSLMVGRESGGAYPPRDRTPGGVVLSVRHVTIRDPRASAKLLVDDVGFDLRRGEILSLYGLVGAGRSETALAMIGAFAGPVECEMVLNGAFVRILSPSDAVENRIGFLPEDRKRQGAVEISSVARNLTMSSLKQISHAGVMDETAEHDKVEELIRMLAIKTPSPETMVRNLSGGNAQKCVLGRWIAADSNILILDEATQGIDVETKFQIYSILSDLAKRGKSILWISSDLSEVIGISDRILTMKNGHVVNITEGSKADRTQILWEAAVGKREDAK